MRRAVLSDPYPLWLEAVEHVLRGLSIEVVGRTTSVHEALELLDRHEPEMFVTEIDTSHAEIDAISFLIRARERLPDLKIIVFSSYDDMYHIESALAAGATAYVIKTTLPQDFASAIRQVSEHSVYLATSLNGAVPLSGGPHRSGFRTRGDKKLNTLTRRELEILRLVADGSSNAALSKTLCVSEQTVKFHLSNIYRKLGVSNRTEASRWAHVRGLLSPYSASSVGIPPGPERVSGQVAEAAPRRERASLRHGAALPVASGVVSSKSSQSLAPGSSQAIAPQSVTNSGESAQQNVELAHGRLDRHLAPPNPADVAAARAEVAKAEAD